MDDKSLETNDDIIIYTTDDGQVKIKVKNIFLKKMNWMKIQLSRNPWQFKMKVAEELKEI